MKIEVTFTMKRSPKLFSSLRTYFMWVVNKTLTLTSVSKL